MQLSGYSFNQYHLTRRLRRGGMGDIYRARDMKLGRPVAIKVVRTDTIHYADEEEARETARLFLRETQMVAKLDHRHILPLYDADEVHIDDMTLLYMVMPLREEGSLTDWLHQYSGGAANVTLPSLHVARIIRQAADALQYAHEHEIVHKDVKPSNFLVRDRAMQPGKLYLQLADFGVAKLMTTTSHSLIIRGTPTYMAPEQWDGQALPASDQYALAIMAYELLTGQVPFEGDNQQLWYQHFNVVPSPPGFINPDVPVELDDVILRALAKTPGERFDSISTFANAFRRAATDAAQRAQQTQSLAPTGIEAAVTSRLPPIAHDAGEIADDEPVQLQGRRGTIRFQAVALAVLALMLIGASLIAVSLFSSHAPDGGLKLPEPTGSTSQASPTENLTATQSRYATNTAQASGTDSAGTATANTATAQASNNAAAVTATARAQASATAAAQASATALAESQATATIAAYYKTATAGKQSFDDSFQNSTDSLNWDNTYSPTYGGCEFIAGGYLASVPQSPSGTFSPCYAEATQYSNFFYEVHLSIIKGDRGGVLFRGDSQNLFFYAFFIDTGGRYELDTYLHNSLSSKIASGINSYINTAPNAINILGVQAQGNTIALFVNRHLLTIVTDSTFSVGQVGVIAAVESNPTDVIFTEAKLSTL